MKINNRNKINDTRTSIEQLIVVLGANITISDTDKGGDIKSVMKTKKNAFIRAKYLIGQLQRIETAEAKDSNIDWYQTKISELVSSAEIAMGELSKIMRENIDLSEGGSSINSAIDSKQDAFDHMDVLSSGVRELYDILKAIEDGEGLKLISDADFKASYAEDHSYENFYAPVKGKYQPGYNEELDAIVISYTGKIGKIVECYGLRIALPKEPTKNTIAGFRKKKGLQYWEREKAPVGLSKETSNLYEEYIEEQFYRRDNGCFFMNNGEVEYITGANWMLLQHYKTDAPGGYFNFRKAHRDLFYFLEACWVDDRSLGAMLGKTRRTGATFCAVAFQMTKAISIRESKFGITSKKDTDAGHVFAKETNMFKKMPFYFKPINTGESFSKILAFNIPSSKTTKNSKEITYDELNSQIDFQATNEDSYDSLAMRFYIADEFSKWLKGNILTHWSMVRKTLLEGSVLKGKVFVLSTVENVTGKDGYDDTAKNGDRFKTLYNESRLETRMENGSTTSGLYKIFIPAHHNFGGFIDLYGNCITNDPIEPIMGAHGKMIKFGVLSHLERLWRPYKSNPGKLNDEKRKDPLTEDDMFRIASSDSEFDTVKLQDQMDYNDIYYIKHGKNDYYTGDFRYKSLSCQDDVEWIDKPNGKFQVSWMPEVEMRNNAIIKNGLIAPSYDDIGTFGIDPYKNNKVQYGSGSKGAMVGYLGAHPHDGIPKNQYFLVYLNRPQMKDIFFADTFMAMRFFSMPSLIENNIPEILYVMKEKGLTRFSMRRPDKIKLSGDELMYGGIPSTDLRLIRTQCQYLEQDISQHIGIADNNDFREIGSMGVCPFNDLLSDMVKFDVNDRTKYDATVAAGLAVYGSQKYMLKNLKNTQRPDSSEVFANFYNRSYNAITV